MNEEFIVSDFFKFIPHSYSVEGAKFELITLTDEMAEQVQACDSYEGMVSLAADSGLACNDERIIDNERLATRIGKLWKDQRLDIDCEPSIKHQVGVYVCEISGLTEMLEEQLELEKPEEIVINEEFIAEHGETSLEQLHEDADATSTIAAQFSYGAGVSSSGTEKAPESST